MAQLGSTMSEAWHWWVGEITTILPARWRRSSRQRITGRVAFADDKGNIELGGSKPNPERSVPATILLSRHRALIRTVNFPPLRRSELRKLVLLDLDRLMPFAPGTAWADISASDGINQQGHIDSQVAAIPKAELSSVLEAARAAGLAPIAIGIANTDQTYLDFDFLPAMVADGAAPRSVGAARWWALVAILFAINVGVMVWKDVRRVDDLQALVDGQQPLVTASRKLTIALAGEDKLRAELLVRRRRDNALAALGTVTRILPAGSWVQRYSWTGETLRISGYKQPGVDVLGALRKSGAFEGVQASSSDAAAESGGGQPFEITARWSGRNLSVSSGTVGK
jgi:hypothetical protein